MSFVGDFPLFLSGLPIPHCVAFLAHMIFFLSFIHLSLDIMWDNRIFYHKNKMNMVCVIF